MHKLISSDKPASGSIESQDTNSKVRLNFFPTDSHISLGTQKGVSSLSIFNTVNIHQLTHCGPRKLARTKTPKGVSSLSIFYAVNIHQLSLCASCKLVRTKTPNHHNS